MIRVQPKDKILIMAPHPDDESIGMGGFLALYGGQCDVLLLTDGRCGKSKDSNSTDDEIVLTRNKEIRNALRICNCNRLICLNINDRQLFRNRKVLRKVDISEYDLIFIPNRYERHVDHMAVYPIVKKMLSNTKASLFEYEVWTPLDSPTDYLDISKVIDTKKQMINQHVTQIDSCDFDNKAVGLNCYRGMFAGCEYAEAFMESRLSLSKKLKRVLPISVLCWVNTYIRSGHK